MKARFFAALFLTVFLLSSCSLPAAHKPDPSSVTPVSSASPSSDSPSSSSSPTEAPTADPTATPVPTETPSPTPVPTETPSEIPTESPSPTPEGPFVPYRDIPTVYVHKDKPLALTQYYWRSQLTESERSLYDDLLAVSETKTASVRLSRPVKIETVNKVLTLFILDHPEIFWWGPQYTTSGTMLRVNTITLTLLYTPEEIETRQKQIDSVTNRILAGLDENATDIEAELYFHDWLCDNVAYTSSDEADGDVYTLFGALVQKKAVCEGYTEAFQYLCGKVGIPCFGITGSALLGGEKGNHKWNGVRIGGAWYLIDPTWDDGGLSSGSRHDYFNLTAAAFSAEHTADALLSPLLPSFTAEEANYFVCRGLVCDADTLDDCFIRALGYAVESGSKEFAVELKGRTHGDAAICQTILTAVNAQHTRELLSLFAEETGITVSYRTGYELENDILRVDLRVDAEKQQEQEGVSDD